MHNINNPRELNIILDDIVNTLNSNGIFSATRNKNLTNLVVEYFMKKLGLENSVIEYQKLDKGETSRVSEAGNLITISTKMLSPIHQADLITAIIHELRHIYQKENPTANKKVNQTVDNMYPMKKCTLDSYQEDFKGKINTHAYYITSLTEKDARDYANMEYLKLLEEIKTHKNSTKKSDRWADKQSKKVSEIIELENTTYTDALTNVYATYPLLKEIIPFKIDLAISQMEQKFANQKSVIGNSRTFDKYLYFYCDNNITKKILDFATKTKDIDSLLVCINNPNTKISEQDFLNMLNVYSPKHKIIDTYVLMNLLPNWEKSEITRLCNLYNKKFAQKQNSNKPSQKNTKLYKSLKLQKQKNSKKSKKEDIYE